MGGRSADLEGQAEKASGIVRGETKSPPFLPFFPFFLRPPIIPSLSLFAIGWGGRLELRPWNIDRLMPRNPTEQRQTSPAHSAPPSPCWVVVRA